MKKYSSEDYFSVIEIKTGRKIVDCGEELDALAMVAFDPKNRTITRNKILMSPVIDIEIPKALPTSNVVVENSKENGCSPKNEQLFNVSQVKLPEGQGEPVVV